MFFFRFLFIPPRTILSLLCRPCTTDEREIVYYKTGAAQRVVIRRCGVSVLCAGIVAGREHPRVFDGESRGRGRPPPRGVHFFTLLSKHAVSDTHCLVAETFVTIIII